MNDVQIAIWVGLVAALVLCTCVLYIVGQNRGSQAIVFAAGTVISTIALFVIQTGYELRRTSQPNWVRTNVIVDLAKPEIRLQPPRTVQEAIQANPRSVIGELADKEWLKRHSDLKQQNLEKLTTDFVVLKILELFSLGEPDWQMRTAEFGGRGAVVTEPRLLSKPGECCYVTEDGFRRTLENAKNIFADAFTSIAGGRTALPPGSEISVSSNSIVLRNPICQMTFTVETRGSDSLRPIVVGGETTRRVDSQYFNFLFGIDIETVYFATRAKSPYSDKYHEWSERVVRDCAHWFLSTNE